MGEDRELRIMGTWKGRTVREVGLVQQEGFQSEG